MNWHDRANSPTKKKLVKKAKLNDTKKGATKPKPGNYLTAKVGDSLMKSFSGRKSY